MIMENNKVALGKIAKHTCWYFQRTYFEEQLSDKSQKMYKLF